MPGYIQKVLHKFQHPATKHPKHTQYQAEAKKYITGVQYKEITATEKPLLPAARNITQQK